MNIFCLIYLQLVGSEDSNQFSCHKKLMWWRTDKPKVDNSYASFKSPLRNAFLIPCTEKLHNKACLTWTLYLDNSGCLLDSSLLQRSWIKQAHSSEFPAYFCNYYISRLLAVIRNGLTQWVLGLLPWSSPRGCPESVLASIRNTLLTFYLVARKRFLLPCHNSTMFEESASMWLFHF